MTHVHIHITEENSGIEYSIMVQKHKEHGAFLYTCYDCNYL